MSASLHVRTVSSFAELMATPLVGDLNALCWSRRLVGDFSEIIKALHVDAGMTTVDEDDLRALRLSPAGARARATILADQVLLREAGLQPTLDCIVGYPRDDSAGPMSTDVYSFHVDSAPVPADTYLCTYIGATSEGLPNASAVRRVHDAATRAALLKQYGGADDADFEAYLREHHYDLHYAARPGAETYTFGVGNLWRIAIAHPACLALPCIHRAPETRPGDSPRLLLIS